jgi:DedD protein
MDQTAGIPPISPGMQQPNFSQEPTQNVSGVTTEGLQLPSSALSPEHAEKGNMFPESNQVMPSEALPEQQTTAVPSLANPAATVANNQVVDVAPEATPVVEPIAPKAVVKKTVVKKGKAHKGKVIASRSWSVQVGSFSDQARAQKLVNNLQSKGYHVYLQKITTSRGPMVRVLVGREPCKAKAVQLASQLKTKLKIDGRVVRNKK